MIMLPQFSNNAKELDGIREHVHMNSRIKFYVKSFSSLPIYGSADLL